MDPRKVLQEKQYKQWDKCVWVKCIKGIGATKETQASKKSKVFDNTNKLCPPDLKEDHLKITVLKQSPNYPSLFAIFCLFSELQSPSIKDESYIRIYTDFRVSPHTLQEAANVHKVANKDIVDFLEVLCSKPMGPDAYQFFAEHGVKVIINDAEYTSIPGEYKYIEDTTIPHLALELQGTTRLRNHQLEALFAVFPPSRVPRVALSGVLEMPCGSGKTLTGIAIACKIQKSTLVLCNNSNAVDHWRSEFLRFSNISERGITRATGEIKDELFKTSGVLITTYSMLAVKEGKSKHSKYLVDTVKSRTWGCVLFDEVHHLPASGISSVAANLRGKCKVGLTGTLNREDSKITHLDDLVGPCLYRTNLQVLREQQLVANIVMKQIMCEMDPNFMKYYNCVRGKSAHRVRSILSVLSPHKFHVVLSLITKHEGQGDKILIFVDNKFEIQEYAKRLSRPFISGDTDKQTRESLFKDFVSKNTVNSILITRTGDESLNLPVANVVIQTSFHHGANNQEMQRLGRILRPKGGAVHGQIEGVFYSLVSKGTREIIYAKRRRKLVTADGVEYVEEEAVINPAIHFPTQSEQTQLIDKVLAHYSTSAYLDLNAPSDHAKKVLQELAKQQRPSKSKAIKEKIDQVKESEGGGDKEDKNEDEKDEEDEEDEEDEDSEDSEDNEDEDVEGNGHEEEEKKVQAMEGNKSDSHNKINGSGLMEENLQDTNITGKKRAEPEPDIVPTSTYHAKPQPVLLKKAFQPNIVVRKK